jgi:Na+/pantothenate symporter
LAVSRQRAERHDAGHGDADRHIVLLVGVVHAAGGLTCGETLKRSIRNWSPQGADDILSPTFMTSFWVLVCFGVIGLPHTAVRCISYKDSKAVHRASSSAPSWSRS